MKSEIAFLALHEASAMFEILVLAEGEVRFSNNEPLYVDEDAAKKIIAAFKTQGVQLPIDYEHATVIKGEKAEKAPAAGWITKLRWEPRRGLVASVEWTDEAADYIKGNEYKYLSPVVLYNKETRSPYLLHSMALTNKPATKDQRELLAASATLFEEALPMASKTTEASGRDVKKKGVVIAQDEGGEGEGEAAPLQDTLAVLIGELAGWLKADGVVIEEGASLEVIIKAAIEDRKGAGGGEGEATPEEVAARDSVLKVLKAKDGNEAILKLKADFVPRADYKLLSDRFTALEERDKGREIEAVLAKMIDENKINPNDEEQMKACRGSAEKDLAAFTAFMAAQPSYIEPGRKVTPIADKGGSREAVIVASLREYDAQEPTAQALCTRRGWTNDELRSKGLTVMTADEMTKLGVTK